MAGFRASLRVGSLLSRSQALLEHGQPKDAEPLCREVLTLKPQSEKAWVYLSWAYLDLNRFPEALEACDRALSINPRSAWAWKNKGVALIRLKRYEDALLAVAHVPRGLYTRPTTWTRAEALSALGQYESLLALAKEWIKDNPKELRNWFWLGKALIALKRYEEALTAFTESTRQNQRYVDGWAGQAFALLHLKRYSEALDVCDFILAIAPENRDAWRAKGLCFTRERRFSEAIVAYDHVLTLPNSTSIDHANRGWPLMRTGRYAEAARAYASALALEPENPTTLNNLGCVYTRLQYYERALGLFDRVRALNEHYYYFAWMNGGEVLVCLGRHDEAHTRLMRAKELRNTPDLSINPASLPAWLGILYTREGRFEEALAAFKEALGADPDDSEACWGFAELLLALGETEKATSMIERSLTLDPFDARAWSLKGRILRAAGDEGGADEAEAHGQAMLAEQRAQLAAWEREHPEWAGA